MATDNPRVAKYLSPENHKSLKAYCKHNGIKSLSAGIDRILSEFFNNLPEIPACSTQHSLSEDLLEREERLAILAESLNGLKSTVASIEKAFNDRIEQLEQEAVTSLGKRS
jgi:hypothetical protein